MYHRGSLYERMPGMAEEVPTTSSVCDALLHDEHNQARATRGEYEHDVCEAPRPEEWLIAARQRGFTVGQAFEYVAEPAEEPCAYSAEVVEDEGVDVRISTEVAEAQVPRRTS